MEKNLLRAKMEEYGEYLMEEERSPATVKKYLRDIGAFYMTVDCTAPGAITKEEIINYKRGLIEKFKATSVNSMLVAINNFFSFVGQQELRVKLVKVQRQTFRSAEKELPREEYIRLLSAARRHQNERLYFLLQAICSTGIRVSEHRFVTVEALKARKACVNNKGKIRTVFLTNELCTALLQYCKRKNITAGPVFITCHGKPVNRSNIWTEMKKIVSGCEGE